MTDILNREERDELRRRYEAAKTMPEDINAAKRVNITKFDFGDDWWVGFGKDESCQIEGTANHWRWLAMLTLGLADSDDAPYSDDKPTPDVIDRLLATVDALEKERDAARAALAALDAEVK